MNDRPSPYPMPAALPTPDRWAGLGRLLGAMILAGAAALAAPQSALAQSSGTEVSTVTLVPGWYTDDGAHIGGIRIDMVPGWHTYWRSPGGAGIPPQFDWSGSDGAGAVEVHWPRPDLYDAYDMRSAVYHDQVYLPITIPDATPGDRLRLSMFYGVCEEICIPAEAQVVLTLPPRAGTGADAARLQSALASGPRDARGAGVTAFTCALRPADQGYTLTAKVRFSGVAPTPGMSVFETGSDSVWITTTRVERGATTLDLEARVDHMGAGALVLDRSALRLTLLGDGRAIALRGCTGG